MALNCFPHHPLKETLAGHRVSFYFFLSPFLLVALELTEILCTLMVYQLCAPDEYYFAKFSSLVLELCDADK